MYGNTDYGPVQRILWCSRTGRNYRAQIELLNVSPTADPPDDRLELLEDGCSIVWDAGSAGMLAPVVPSKLTLKVTSLRGDWRESLGMLMGRPDGQVRCFIEADDNEDGTYETVEWAGYLEQALSWQTTTESGIRDGVTLSYNDGFGFVSGESPLSQNSFGLPTTFRVLNNFRRFLRRLAGFSSRATWSNLVSATAWRPWIEGTEKISFLEDPLYRLSILEKLIDSIYEEGDGVDSVQFTRLLASRFNARMYQSGGGWYIDQPSNLGRSASIAGGAHVPGNVRQWNTIIPVSLNPGSGTVTIRRVNAARTWELVEAPVRAQDIPTNRITSSYDFEPDAPNFIRNGSFEFGAPHPGTSCGAVPCLSDADAWAFSAGGGRVRGDDDFFSTVPFTGYVEDAFYGYIPAGADPVAAQGSVTNVIDRVGRNIGGRENTGIFLRYYVLQHLFATTNFNFVTTALGVLTPSGEVWSTRYLLEPIGQYVSGKDIEMRVTGLSQNPAWEPGVELIPEGATLYVNQRLTTWEGQPVPPNQGFGKATLKKTALAGDDHIVVDIEGLNSNEEGTEVPINGEVGGATNDNARFYAWDSNVEVFQSDAQTGFQSSALHQQYTPQRFLSGVDARDGTPIVGEIQIIISNSGTNNDWVLIDGVALEMKIAGSDVTAAACTVDNEDIAHGLSLDLPLNDARDHIVGDGPVADDTTNVVSGPFIREASRGGLYVISRNNNVTGFGTERGIDTSWTSGRFLNADPPTGGSESFVVAPGIDCLAAEDGIRLRSNDAAGGQQFINGKIILPSGDALRPHDVPVLSLRAYLTTTYGGGTTIRTTFPPDVIQGVETIALCTGGLVEERQVSAVVRANTDFIVTLETAFSGTASAGDEVTVAVLAWWTRYEWDLIEDTVDFQGQSIIPNDDLDVTHSNIWRTQ